MEFIYALIGLVLLFVGGEALVRGSVVISSRLGISQVLIGVVVVGFGTSTPELLVSLQAAMNGQPDIALGNIVGSNIANVMLILAIAALIFPLPCHDKAIKRDSIMVIVASVILMALVPAGIIDRNMGLAMIVLLAGYIFYSYKADRAAQKLKNATGPAVEEIEIPKMSLPVSIVAVVGGIAVLMVGAHYLIEGATTIARDFGVSEAIIGLTLVAVGTSLPELAASVIGAWKKQTDMVVGNILGSNMYNILGILGVASVVQPIPMMGRIAELDIPIMLVIAVATTAVIFAFGKISRPVGAVALVAYIAYVGWMFTAGHI